MDIIQLYIDYSIDHSTEHKNVRNGWVGTNCPFCGSTGKYHFGYSIDEDYFSCWQCGGHSVKSSIARLLGVNVSRAEEIIEKYGGAVKHYKKARVRIGKNKFKLPSGSLKLEKQHKLYLKRRGFDWEELARTWGIMGTGPSSKLISHDKEQIINYSNRILAPIIWDGRIVSFQARDISNKHMAKYMACPPEREIISHKHILYGLQDHWGDRGICVEGIFDAWRFGPRAFATFGVKFTQEQLIHMERHFKEIVIAYDPEKQAQKQAKLLMKELGNIGVNAWTVQLPCDPGDMSPMDAEMLVETILI